MTKRSHLKICCSPLVIDQPKIIKTPPQEAQSPELRLLQDDFSTDPQNWDINLCLHNAATLDPPYISTVKALLVEHPESVKTRNKYGRLPLHCAVDKVFCSPELVRILVEAYPEGAAEEDDTGRSPLACALRWEHSNTILMIMLRHNRFIYCVEYAAKKFGGRKRSLSVSYAPSESHRAPVQGRRSFDGAKGRTQSEDTAYCNLP